MPILIASERVLSSARMQPTYFHKTHCLQMNSDLPNNDGRPNAINQTELTITSD